jgi:hypothetical protein
MVTGYSNQKLSEIGIWNRGWCYVNIYGTKFLRKLRIRTNFLLLRILLILSFKFCRSPCYNFSTYFVAIVWTFSEVVIRGLLEKFVGSPYYSESELCGCAVTVSFSKYLPWQAMDALLTTLHQLLEYLLQTIVTSKFLDSELPFHGWKSPEIARGEIKTVWRMFWWGSTHPLLPSRTQNSIHISLHAISGLFQPWKVSSKVRNFEMINGLQHVLEKVGGAL